MTSSRACKFFSWLTTAFQTGICCLLALAASASVFAFVKTLLKLPAPSGFQAT
jgi:hypothetical protein